MAMTADMRELLEEKHAAGVKQVRVATALERLDADRARLRGRVEAAAGRDAKRLARELEAQRRQVALAREETRAVEAVLLALRDGVTGGMTHEQVVRRVVDGGDSLMGTAEVATLLGVERTRIGKWQRVGQMPQPIDRLASGPVWLRSQVEPLVARVESRRRGGDRSGA